MTYNVFSGTLNPARFTSVRYEQQEALSSLGFVYELHTYYDRCTFKDVMELFKIKCGFQLMNPCRCKCGFE